MEKQNWSRPTFKGEFVGIYSNIGERKLPEGQVQSEMKEGKKQMSPTCFWYLFSIHQTYCVFFVVEVHFQFVSRPTLAG